MCHHCDHFIMGTRVVVQQRRLPVAVLRGLLEWNTTDASGMWPSILLNRTKGCFPSINHWRPSWGMIVPAGGHSQAVAHSPVGGLGPVIVLRPAGESPGDTGMSPATL